MSSVPTITFTNLNNDKIDKKQARHELQFAAEKCPTVNQFVRDNLSKMNDGLDVSAVNFCNHPLICFMSSFNATS